MEFGFGETRKWRCEQDAKMNLKGGGKSNDSGVSRPEKLRSPAKVLFSYGS